MLPEDCTEFPTEVYVDLDQRSVTGYTWLLGTHIL